ncbi:unnamed protein product [Closterium sp. NIES-54]
MGLEASHASPQAPVVPSSTVAPAPPASTAHSSHHLESLNANHNMSTCSSMAVQAATTAAATAALPGPIGVSHVCAGLDVDAFPFHGVSFLSPLPFPRSMSSSFSSSNSMSSMSISGSGSSGARSLQGSGGSWQAIQFAAGNGSGLGGAAWWRELHEAATAATCSCENSPRGQQCRGVSPMGGQRRGEFTVPNNSDGISVSHDHKEGTNGVGNSNAIDGISDVSATSVTSGTNGKGDSEGRVPEAARSDPLQWLPRYVKVVEVGPRDGLQNEKQQVAVGVKVELIHRLMAAGLPVVEATSFVSPKWIPQNEKQKVAVGVKVELIHRLMAAELPVVEATSFVSPKWIPQVAVGVKVELIHLLMAAGLPVVEATSFVSPKWIPQVRVSSDAAAYNEYKLAVGVKMELIHCLMVAGLPVVEATSGLVSPKWIPQVGDAASAEQPPHQATGSNAPIPNLIPLPPAHAPSMQLSDAPEVMQRVQSNGRTKLPVLTPNLRGLENAVAAGAKEVAVFAAASEAFSKKNINCSVEESLERYRAVCDAAKDRGIPVRG